VTKRYSTRRIVGFLFGLYKTAPVLSWAMIVIQTIYAILSATVAPVFVSQLLTNIARGNATLNSSIGLLIGYAIVLILGDVVAMRITIALAYEVELRMQSKVSLQVFRHISAKSLSYHSNQMSGGIVSNANKLNGSIERFWDSLVFTAVPIAATIISVCLTLSFIFWQFAIALAILSAIIIVVIVKSQTNIAPISKQVAEKSSAMTAYFADAITNIAAVKAYAREEAELEHYSSLVKDWRQTSLKEMKSVLLISGSFSLMMMIMNLCAFIAAVLATEYHIAGIGTIYLVINYTLNVVSELWAVSNTTRTFIRVIGDAGPMISILDEPIDLKDPTKPLKLAVKHGKIEFKNISFTHSDNHQALFDNFSMTIQPGEQVGLVGRSGAGKTSLTRLLLRFSDVDSGQILIDGQDISKVRQADLHRVIAYVPQEPMLFHRSLRENIAYGKPDASDEEIRQAADRANALDFIEAMPQGLDAMVGERGTKLSGGQRQRVAIARAILKDAPILILDEATSALDSESEKLVQDALVELMHGRTAIVIAHRLSTIASLDRIVVLENGQITEQGSHSQLLEHGATYAKLWSRQSGGFMKE
jgi:ATP-binding cassette subfamily B protein